MLGTGKPARAAKALPTLPLRPVASLCSPPSVETLPHTPPRPATAGQEKFAWLEAMRLLKIPYVAVLFFVTFLDSAVHQGYFIFAGRFLESRVGIPGNWVMPVMSIGQFAEIGTMAVLGMFLKRLGWRKTMVIGILHAVRFLIFALFPGQPWLIVSIIVRTASATPFFATVPIFVDEFFKGRPLERAGSLIS